jgi:phosphate transport system protein
MSLVGLPEVELPVDIPRLSGAAGGMIRRALEAFIAGDDVMAEAVLRMDDIVDRMNREIFQSVVKRMHEAPEVIPQSLDALLIARNFERIGDHATNIAEDVIFWVRGSDVRHHGSVAAEQKA